MSFSVVVPLEELRLALRTLAKVVKKRQASEAVLSLSGDKLSISLPGASAFVPASGTWPGTVRASGHFFLLLSKALPAEDPVHVSVHEDRLRIASTSIPCTVTWRETGTVPSTYPSTRRCTRSSMWRASTAEMRSPTRV